MNITTRGPRETEALAAAFGDVLDAGDLVVLSGDLGSGKTTFVKGVARALGVQDTVTSPTFTIVQEYDGRVRIAHVDVYRLGRIQELYDFGFEELFDDRVVLIEWGDTVDPALPRDRVDVRFALGDDIDERHIEIDARGPSWRSRAEVLAEAIGAR
jgi:tRNA threonylcarbamoyladenosine biosynthesis protein TsaE